VVSKKFFRSGALVVVFGAPVVVRGALVVVNGALVVVNGALVVVRGAPVVVKGGEVVGGIYVHLRPLFETTRISFLPKSLK